MEKIFFWKCASRDTTQVLDSTQLRGERRIDQNNLPETVPSPTTLPASNKQVTTKSLGCPATHKNNHARGTTMNKEPETNPKALATVITVANEDTGNGNVVRRNQTKHHNKRHRTNDESKQNGQNATLNWYAKTVVIQNTQLVTAAKTETKHQPTGVFHSGNKTLKKKQTIPRKNLENL